MTQAVDRCSPGNPSHRALWHYLPERAYCSPCPADYHSRRVEQHQLLASQIFRITSEDSEGTRNSVEFQAQASLNHGHRHALQITLGNGILGSLGGVFFAGTENHVFEAPV